MRFSAILLCTLLSVTGFAQVAKLGVSINRGGTNNFYPTLSGDGRLMLYRSDLSREGEELWITSGNSSGRWGLQERFTKVIDLPGVNTLGGNFLNIDGTLLIFSSKRYGSIGGFDIWFSEKKGSGWGPPQNGGKPLNSSSHEGDPSLSPDGKTLYFMRCEGLGLDEAINCSIWTAQRKSNGYFEEPVKLPEPINRGHETSPLILADNESLVFASSRPGGKGGLDLYLSRKTENGWSEPVAMDFLNTENDDRYVSIPARGDIAYFSRKEGETRNLYMAKIPEELRPFDVLYLESRAVSSSGDPLEVTVQYSPVDQESKFVTSEANGTFNLTLKEGHVYDVAILDREGKYLFNSERFDLNDMEGSRRERREFELQQTKDGAILPMNNLFFKEYSAEIDPVSEKELQRLIFMMQKNPSLNVEITVALENYREDTTRSDPDLTELVVDTIHTTNIVERYDTIWHAFDFESLLHNPRIDYIMVDSVLLSNPQEVDRVIDSLNNAIYDSQGSFETIVNYDTIQETKIKYTYHNDRSEQQAFAVANYLKAKGAPSYRISTKGIRRDNGIVEEKEVTTSVRFYK